MLPFLMSILTISVPLYKDSLLVSHLRWQVNMLTFFMSILSISVPLYKDIIPGISPEVVGPYAPLPYVHP
jgi:hypothetical protein